MNKSILLTTLWLAFATLLTAQINDGGSRPVSFEYSGLGQTVPVVVAPSLDMDKVRAEDRAHAEKGELYTIGRILPVRINPKTMGEWQSLRNGDRVWRVRIQSKDAEGISLYFSQFHLPKGARLYAYSADKNHVLGGFTSQNNHESGFMATSHVYSDDIIVEYYEPVFATGQGRFIIEEIGHGYKDVRDFGDSGSCEVNVNCSEGTGRTNQRNAVARVLVRVGAQQGWCSGTMVNNVRQDCTPYYLTAWHCGEGASTSDFNQWVFYFNYQGTGCPDPASQPTIQSLVGGVRRAYSNDGGGATGSDFLLMELNNTPPAGYNVYYAGWNRNNTATTGGYGIHHPAGDIKKISTFTGTTTSTSWGGSVANTHWGVTWVATANGHGVTEGGSSGSGLFNSSGLLIGTLTGGGSSCASRTSPDAYGKMSYHWTSNGATALLRLGNWLDPDNTGATTLAGIAAPCTPTGNDAGISLINTPATGSFICTNPLSPIVTINNFGSTTLTSATIRYRIDAGTVNSFNWTGSLATSASTTVALPSTTFPTGAAFTFRAWTALPNGGADVNIANDTAQAVSQYNIGLLPPYSEAFNAGSLPANIDLLDPNADNFIWAYQAGVSAYGVGTGSMKYDNYNGTAGSNPGGTLDWFLLPTLDLSGQTNPQLTFDVAYAMYGASNSDSLIVAVATACSPNFQAVYLQGGSTLATRAGNVTAIFTPTSAEWANKSINLAAYAGQSHVSIAFINKSGYGNNMYIDNINVGSSCTVSATVASQTNVLCNGSSTGSVSINATGGSTPYTYNRGTGAQTSSTFTGLAAGTYNITVTDNLSCTFVQAVTISQPAAVLAATTSSQTNIACFGGATGSFTIAATGGTPSYTYNRGTGSQTSGTFSGVAAGTYNVTVTDANGCTTVRPVTLTQPTAALAATTSSQTNIACFGGATGSFTIAATGGTPSYTYNRGTGAQTSSTFTGLAAGTYNVTVTDANGCTAIRVVTLTQPTAVLAATTSSQTNIGCFGSSTGSFIVAATGGTSPYTFNRGTGAQTSGTFSGLAAGTYNVTVTDANGCTTVRPVTLTQTGTALTASTSSQTNVSCFGGTNGSFTLGVTGGTASYTYNRGTGSQTSGTFSGLAAGTYNVTVTDANGCTTVRPVTLTQPTAALAATTSSQTNIACFGGATGSFTIAATGGTPSYTYNRGTGAQTASTFTGVAAGTYNVTVTDANGCTAVRTVTLTQPTAALAATTSSQTNLSCLNSGNGSFTVAATGGTSPYTYNRGTGAQASGTFSSLAAGTYNVTVTDANGCTVVRPVTLTQPATGITTSISTQTNIACNGGNTGSFSINATGGTAPYSFNRGTGAQSNGTFAGLAAGTYNVTVSDNGGCTAVQTVVISQPAVLASNIGSQTNISCFGSSNGSFTIVATGGTTPYTFNRGTGAQSSGAFSSLAVGTYNVTVTDANGCTSVQAVNISQPSTAVSATLSGQNPVSCFGGSNGSFNIAASGGSTPYTFNRGAGAQSNGVFNNVAAGNYTVTVTDANGCQTTQAVTVSQPASAVALSLNTQTNVACLGGNNGSVSLAANGGLPSYIFNIGTGAQASGTFNNLSAGTYNITVSDANGCTAVQNVIISQPSTSFGVSVSTTSTTCAGGDGSAIAIGTGGNTPYTFVWSNAASGNAISSLNVGSVSVTATDNNGCAVSANGFVGNGCSASCNITVTGAASNVACFGACTGSVQTTMVGGTAPFNYSWSNSGNASAITAVCAGSYTVTVTDNAGCTATNNFAISQPASAVSATATSTNSEASATATGGTSPYSFVWTNGETTATITGVAAGAYTATVTDANGCTSVSNAVNVIVGVVENNLIGTFNVYPNPTTGDFSIEIRSSSSEDMHVRIVDVLGRELQQFHIQTNEIILPISLTEQASGIYFVVLQTGNTMTTKKVVLTRE
jgi:hypothetical protein